MERDTPRCDLTVIILTLNEELHIRRCIESAWQVARRVVVVDSGSTDRTRAIAEALDAAVYVHPFTTHAAQFNWALDNTAIATSWVMKLDADENLTDGLVGALPATLSDAGIGVSGFTLNRRIVFMGQWLRHGTLYPVRHLRVWRHPSGRVEPRFMDEHVVVEGVVRHIDADFVDDNLNSLTWWTEKHNRYATREAIDLLRLEAARGWLADKGKGPGGSQARAKRWTKERLYARLPGGWRALAYFLYRYLLRLGFLDGRRGAVFHVLQGFWYRYLVDAKVFEVLAYRQHAGVSLDEAIEKVLGITVPDASASLSGR